MGSINDDDTAGVVVSPANGLVTTEAGGAATFTVVLASQPLDNVTIPVSSSDTTEATVPASVVFTAANWNIAQTVTVTGVDDALDDGDIAWTIVTGAATSADASYNGLASSDVTGTTVDDDIATVIVAPIAGLTTTEAAGTAQFTVVLGSQPTANVSIGVTSNDTTEGVLAAATVDFTAANWNVPQAVTVTGVEDVIDDGDIAYSIVTAAATSADPSYNGSDAADVMLTNVDDDTAGVIVNAAPGLSTTEAGGSATLSVSLSSQPSADVSIALSSSDTTEGTTAPASLLFTAANWNIAQVVTATGVNDSIDDGDIAYAIVFGATTSADPGYAGLAVGAVSLTNIDNDGAGISVAPTAGLATSEAGGTATFTVVLNSQPTADVSLALAGSDATEGSVAPATLIFTTANWNQPRTVTATGVDDLQFDGDIAWTIALGNATSTDPLYSGMAGGNVALSNADDDVDRFTAATATGSGNASVVVAGGMCSIDMAQSSYIGIGGLQIPTGTGFPHGALRLRAQGCTPGASLTVTLTLPSRPDGSQLFGLDAVDAAVVRAFAPNVATSLQYTLVDGGALDGDGVLNGVIIDLVALGVVQVGGSDGAIPIPAASDWSRLAMLLAFAMLGALALCRRAD